jgi:pimeloyl-ACP methyl ester carboxylesterase
VLAQKLVARGFAVLRVDDRGTGASSGSADDTAIHEALADARAAVGVLREQPGIDPRHLFLVGHSEGGLVAATLAHQISVAGVVMLAGPGCPIDQLLHDQSATIARAAGATAAQVTHERAMNEAVFQLVAGPMDTQAARTAAAAVIADHLCTWPGLAPLAHADLTESSRLMASVVASPSFRSLLRQQPMAILRGVPCPLLAVFAERDMQVRPELNLGPVQEALAASAVPGSSAVVLPGLNHLLQEARTGLIEEYEALGEAMHDRAVNTLATWLHGICARR